MLNWAAKALYGQLLTAGIEIHEYTQSFLHAKVASVDDAWCTVGSSNIDPLSLLLAREANLVVRDHEFARSLRGEIEHLMRAGGRPISPAQWARRNWLIRVGHWCAYGAVRVLITFFAFGARDYRT
jgi:cardiolipin synthase